MLNCWCCWKADNLLLLLLCVLVITIGKRGNGCSRNNGESSLVKMLLPRHFHVSETRVFLLGSRAEAWEEFVMPWQQWVKPENCRDCSLSPPWDWCRCREGQHTLLSFREWIAWTLLILPETLGAASHFNHSFNWKKKKKKWGHGSWRRMVFGEWGPAQCPAHKKVGWVVFTSQRIHIKGKKWQGDLHVSQLWEEPQSGLLLQFRWDNPSMNTKPKVLRLGSASHRTLHSICPCVQLCCPCYTQQFGEQKCGNLAVFWAREWEQLNFCQISNSVCLFLPSPAIAFCCLFWGTVNWSATQNIAGLCVGFCICITNTIMSKNY